MEDDLKKNGRQPKKNGRQPKGKEKNGRQLQKKEKKGRQKFKKMEDDLKHNLKKSTLIGCDIIENYPS